MLLILLYVVITPHYSSSSYSRVDVLLYYFLLRVWSIHLVPSELGLFTFNANDDDGDHDDDDYEAFVL